MADLIWRRVYRWFRTTISSAEPWNMAIWARNLRFIHRLCTDLFYIAKHPDLQ